jgi:hypothetical protein
MKYKNYLPLFLFSITALIIAFKSDHSLFIAIMNSDALYIPTMVDDVVSRSGSIQQWHLTPAPYFFPDGLIYLLVSLVGIRPYPGIYVYSILQYLATVFFVYQIYRVFNKQKSSGAAALAAVILAVLALFVGDNITLSTTGNTFSFILTTAFHYGSFLASLIAFWVSIKYLTDGDSSKSRIYLPLTLTVVCAAATLSDSLFIVQFTAPILGALALNYARDRKKGLLKYLVLFALIMLGSLLGHLAYDPLIANKSKYALGIDLSNLNAKINVLISFARQLFSDQPLVAAGLVLFYSYSIFSLIKSLINSDNPKSNPNINLLVDFSLLSALSMLSANLLASHMQFGIRYVIPLFYLPIICTVFTLTEKIDKNTVNKLSTLISIALLLGSFALHNDARVTQQRSEATCIAGAIDSSSLKHGVATYWDAKLIQAFANKDIEIAQFTGDLKEYRWITNSAWYRPTYDFLIVSNDQVDFYKIPIAKIIAMSGEPVTTVKCGEKQLLIFEQDKLLLRENKFPKVGSVYNWRACELPTKIGRRSNNCSMNKADPSSSGHLTYGPYDTLPAGQYQVTITYSSREKKAVHVGIWDIALALPSEARVLTHGPILGTDGMEKNIEGTFDVPNEFAMSDFEARTYSLDNTDLTVLNIRVTRLR